MGPWVHLDCRRQVMGCPDRPRPRLRPPPPPPPPRPQAQAAFAGAPTRALCLHRPPQCHTPHMGMRMHMYVCVRVCVYRYMCLCVSESAQTALLGAFAGGLGGQGSILFLPVRTPTQCKNNSRCTCVPHIMSQQTPPLPPPPPPGAPPSPTPTPPPPHPHPHPHPPTLVLYVNPSFPAHARVVPNHLCRLRLREGVLELVDIGL
jgi:hypothetical protein